MLCGITNSQYEENPQGQFVWHNHHLLPWPSTSTAASSYLTRGVDFSIKVKVGCLRTDGYNLYDESPTIACTVKQKKNRRRRRWKKTVKYWINIIYLNTKLLREILDSRNFSFQILTKLVNIMIIVIINFWIDKRFPLL